MSFYTFSGVARIVNIKIGTAEEGGGFLVTLEIFDRKGRKGILLLPYDRRLSLGGSYSVKISLEEITLEEFLEGSPFQERLKGSGKKITGVI